jgi:hypothetical protein
MYPVVRDLLNRAPQIQNWIEKKAKKEDPIFLMQLQLLESVGDLRSYILTTAIMSAMLSNPALTETQIKEKFLKSVEVAGDVLKSIKQITP